MYRGGQRRCHALASDTFLDAECVNEAGDAANLIFNATAQTVMCSIQSFSSPSDSNYEWLGCVSKQFIGERIERTLRPDQT